METDLVAEPAAGMRRGLRFHRSDDASVGSLRGGSDACGLQPCRSGLPGSERKIVFQSNGNSVG